MKTIIFASRNRGKIQEIRAMLADSALTLKTMNDYPDLPEIVEDGNTFLENALKKAKTIAELTGEICLADDSGLEVAALNGAPGIYSSRYAGDGAGDDENIRELLDELRGVPPAERAAAFRCVLVFCQPDGQYQSFDGRWAGRIAEAPAGKGGFGYDPVFFLPEQGVTVAELPSGIKNQISHRAEAFAKLNAWLQKGIEKIGA